LAQVCTHFITGNCKYGKSCREKHDEKVKSQILTYLKLKRKNEKKDKIVPGSNAIPNVAKEEAPKKPLKDLRETVLN
jgi:hypothetical protein